MKKHLLILNPGSSSLKFAVFEVDKKLKEKLSGNISLVNNKTVLTYKRNKVNFSTGFNLKAWWSYVEDLLEKYDIKYVGFRMVHGGEEFTDTVKINKQFLQKIKKYNKLAPLHNPVALELINLVKDAYPDAKMSASFDTAWYKNLKPEAYLYSLPLKYYKKEHIRKYGFHGLSHEAASEFAAKKLRKPLKNLSLITCHLGSGASVTWLEKGKVKDTSMGFSPNEGLTMSTRSGDLPASIVFYLAEELKMSLTRIKDLLNKESGLLGLTGSSDLREVLTRAGYRVAGYKKKRKYSLSERKIAKQALDIYTYDVRRYLAAYLAMSKNVDAIVFSGAAGAKNSDLRKMIMSGIDKPRACKVLAAQSDENKNLVNKTYKCLVKK